jgi:hypothetical protein
MQEGGKALTDLVKAFRLFLAPFQLAATWQDRFERWLERIRNSVPEDRQQEAPASIAGPVIRDLVFMEDDNPLTELYLNLLARAIDKERCNEAHPAFVKIIEQMSPDEAMVMYVMRNERPTVQFSGWVGDMWGNYQASTHTFPSDRLVLPERVWLYFQHLESLNLVSHSSHMFSLTPFGRLFTTACIPEDFDLAKFKSDPTAASQQSCVKP